MKLGLIRAIDYEEPYVLEPLGLLYISSYLKKHLNFENVIIAEHVDSLIKEKPDIVGISTYTPHLSRTIEITDKIKRELAVPVIIGGPHVKLFPGLLPANCDIGVIGEGEETVKELLELYMEMGAFPVEGLHKIEGITFKDGGRRVITHPRKLIEPLDLIPHPRRELLKSHYLMPAIMTGRGCPYRCGFCVSPLVWEKHRMFSREYVCNEIVEILENERSCDRIEIKDDLFAVSVNRVKDISSFIVERGIHKEVSFFVNIRANTFTEEMCSLLKEMNTTRVFVGFESGSEKILSFYNKRQTAEENQRVVDLCKEYDMQVIGSFIIGAPVETEEDIEETYQFIKRNAKNIGSITCSYLVPEPGTPVWDYIKPSLPPLKKEMDILKIMYYKNHCEHVTREQLEYHYKRITDIVTGPDGYLRKAYDFAGKLQKAGFQSPLNI